MPPQTLRAKVVSLGSRVEARASLSEREQAAASRGRPSDVETEELRLQVTRGLLSEMWSFDSFNVCGST